MINLTQIMRYGIYNQEGILRYQSNSAKDIHSTFDRIRDANRLSGIYEGLRFGQLIKGEVKF